MMVERAGLISHGKLIRRTQIGDTAPVDNGVQSRWASDVDGLQIPATPRPLLVILGLTSGLHNHTSRTRTTPPYSGLSNVSAFLLVSTAYS